MIEYSLPLLFLISGRHQLVNNVIVVATAVVVVVAAAATVWFVVVVVAVAVAAVVVVVVVVFGQRSFGGKLVVNPKAGFERQNQGQSNAATYTHSIDIHR